MENIPKNKNAERHVLVVWVFCLLVIASFVAVVARVYVRGDYMLSSEVECDPTLESCFVRLCEDDCDPEEGQEEYYKVRTLSAAYASTCNSAIEECPDRVCSDIPTCVEILCINDNVPEDEWCNEPQAYPAAEHADVNIGETSGILEEDE